MNTAVIVLISLFILVSVALGFIVALKAKRQFGFLAPLAFFWAVLLHKGCVIGLALLPPHFNQPDGQEKLREHVAKLSEDDLLFFLGRDGHATGIWQLGAICFLLCGLFDLKAVKGAPTGRLRHGFIFGGTVFVLLSAFYPHLLMMKLW